MPPSNLFELVGLIRIVTFRQVWSKPPACAEPPDARRLNAADQIRGQSLGSGFSDGCYPSIVVVPPAEVSGFLHQDVVS